MKKLIGLVFLLVFLLLPFDTAQAGYVNGYYRSNGTYVNGYYRSRPNAYTYDNYSYRSPSYSNGYGYNLFYRNYSSRWNTPSWYDNDYGLNYNSWNNGW